MLPVNEELEIACLSGREVFLFLSSKTCSFRAECNVTTVLALLCPLCPLSRRANLVTREKRARRANLPVPVSSFRARSEDFRRFEGLELHSATVERNVHTANEILQALVHRRPLAEQDAHQFQTSSSQARSLRCFAIRRLSRLGSSLLCCAAFI